jgi:hypothetical protein
LFRGSKIHFSLTLRVTTGGHLLATKRVAQHPVGAVTTRLAFASNRMLMLTIRTAAVQRLSSKKSLLAMKT